MDGVAPNLKTHLREMAAELGFQAFGVAPAAAPLPHRDFYRAWLADGCHGEMRWLERNNELRLAPEKLLPGARSILVFGWDSHHGNPARPPGADYAVARYAHGADYHNFIFKRLKKICAFLRERGGEQRPCVDTAPVLEKPLAALAGVGWQGRNTLLIHPRHGPWLLLGFVFTTLEIPPDAPSKNLCGACVRCQRACPTGALDGTGHLDARRCVAYLTIEHDGAIPLELRPHLGPRLFGCDACLDACPCRRKTAAPTGTPTSAGTTASIGTTASASTAPLSSASSVLSDVASSVAPPSPSAPRPFPAPLRDTLSWTEAAYAAWFSGTPLKRLGLRRWLRNACVVLGNNGTEADIPALTHLAHSPDPLLSEHATWALSRLQQPHP